MMHKLVHQYGAQVVNDIGILALGYPGLWALASDEAEKIRDKLGGKYGR
jgi:hypothetical protein